MSTACINEFLNLLSVRKSSHLLLGSCVIIIVSKMRYFEWGSFVSDHKRCWRRARQKRKHDIRSQLLFFNSFSSHWLLCLTIKIRILSELNFFYTCFQELTSEFARICQYPVCLPFIIIPTVTDIEQIVNAQDGFKQIK